MQYVSILTARCTYPVGYAPVRGAVCSDVPAQHRAWRRGLAGGRLGGGVPSGPSLQHGPVRCPADLADKTRESRQYGNSVIVMTLDSAYDTIDSCNIRKSGQEESF